MRIGIAIGEKCDPEIGQEFRAPITNRLIGGERHHPEARMRQSEALGCWEPVAPRTGEMRWLPNAQNSETCQHEWFVDAPLERRRGRIALDRDERGTTCVNIFWIRIAKAWWGLRISANSDAPDGVPISSVRFCSHICICMSFCMCIIFEFWRIHLIWVACEGGSRELYPKTLLIWFSLLLIHVVVSHICCILLCLPCAYSHE